eukprot:1337695-Pyramimonas_sp.AAC.1
MCTYLVPEGHRRLHCLRPPRPRQPLRCLAPHEALLVRFEEVRAVAHLDALRHALRQAAQGVVSAGREQTKQIAVRIEGYHPVRIEVRTEGYHPVRIEVRIAVRIEGYHPVRIAVRIEGYHPVRIIEVRIEVRIAVRIEGYPRVRIEVRIIEVRIEGYHPVRIE